MPCPSLRCIAFTFVAAIMFLTAFTQSKQENKPLSESLPANMRLPIRPLQSGFTSQPSTLQQRRLSQQNSTLETSAFPSYTYPVSDCFTYTYKMSFGATGERTNITETFTTRSGVTYITGFIIAGGVKKGFVQELAMDGSIASTNIYSLSGRDLTFNSIRASANETLLVIGTSQLSNGTDARPYIAELLPAGSIAWSKTVNTPGFAGGYVSASPAAGIGFVAYDASTLIIGSLTATGNLQWLNRTTMLDNGAPIGLVYDGWEAWYVAYSGTISGKRAGSVMRIEHNGTMPWKTIYGGNTSNEYIFHDVEFTNNHIALSGIYNSNGAPYALFNSGIYTTGQSAFIQTFNIAGLSITTTAQSDLTPFATGITFTPSSTSTEVYAIRPIIESNPSDVIQWTKKFPVQAGYSVVNIERSFDGGFIIAGNVGGATTTQGHLFKTDSTGLINDCPGSSFAVSNTYQFVPNDHTTQTPVVSPVGASLTNAATTAAGNMMPVLTECKALTCPVKLPEDTCYESFARRFRSATMSDVALDLIVDPGNKITVIGFQRDNPYTADRDGSFIAEFNNKGKLTSRKKAMFGTDGGYYDAVRLRDGGLLVIGPTLVAKYNANLQLLWNRSWQWGGPQSGYYGTVEGSDGSIYINYVKGAPYLCMTDISILKLNADGSFNWQKNYNFDGRCPFGYYGSINQDENFLYVVNYASPEMALMKIRKTDGSAIWSKGYQVPWSRQTLIGRDISFLGDNLIFHGYAENGSEIKDVIMVVDKNGNTRVKKAINAHMPKMLVTKNSDIVFTWSEFPSKQIFVRLDSNFNVRNSKKIDIPGWTAVSVAEGDDGSILELVNNFYADVYEADFTLLKLSQDGFAGECQTDTFALNIEPMEVSEIDLPPIVKNTTVTFTTLPYNEYGYSLQENYLFCSKTSQCSELTLQGPSSVCDSLPFVVKTARNAECNALVEYFLDNPDVKIVSKADTGIVLKAVKSGVVTVKARMFTGCVWLEDEIKVNMNVIGGKLLNLGKDTILCGSESILVNAGKGFSSYLWNDGTIDSIIRISVPGRYFVNVKDLCDKLFSDTINVAPPSTSVFDVGNDQQICSNQPAKLIAPAGYINYSWKSADGSLNQSIREVDVSPASDMEYYAEAQRRPGCFVRDTVKVQVTFAPVLELGADKSFCDGDSAIIDAGNSFESYAWSTGVNYSTVTVKQNGKYSVIATSAEGCKVYDTVNVNVWENPRPAMDDIDVLCEGKNVLLNPGSGYKSYVWQDGSLSSTYNVNAAGSYYVKVTDMNGCVGSDTAVVKRTVTSPANFLPPDTAVCTYGEVIIGSSADSYQTYEWSNGDRSRSIKIKTPGVYTLEVSDINNCKGIDTIYVAQKACMEGFYVPNAFTPNNDGVNDTFKPVLLGLVTSYKFTVFDRWGNIVFTTTSIENAWDGWVNGRRADGGTYVWQCSYTFAGANPAYEKGYVQLVR